MHCDMRTARLVLLAATLGGIVWVSAGDLNPPPGIVESTMKTLTEVEPRTAINAVNTPGSATSIFGISQPGSPRGGSSASGFPCTSWICPC